MQTTQGQMLQSLRAVQVFLDKNAEKLAGVVKTGTRQRLDDVIGLLSAHVSNQTGSHLAAQGATQQQRALKETLLRDHMAPISRIARADLPPTPALEPLKMPKGRPTIERLAGLAYGMGEAAAQFKSAFIDAGLPVDFIEQLNAAADALVFSLNDRTQSRGRRRGASQGLKKHLTAGRKIVHVLDAFVRSALKSDPVLLASWDLVKRVPRNTNRSASSPLSPTTLLPPAQEPTDPPPSTSTDQTA